MMFLQADTNNLMDVPEATASNAIFQIQLLDHTYEATGFNLVLIATVRERCVAAS
jgi:hypothetical protein